MNDISDDTRYLLDIGYKSPVVKDYINANDLAVHYQDTATRQEWRIKEHTQRIATLEAENAALKVDATRYQQYATILQRFVVSVEWEYEELPEDVWAICQYWGNNVAIDTALKEVK